MKVEIAADGTIRRLHSDRLDLSSLGKEEVTRASHIEYDNANGKWLVQSARTLTILAEGFNTRAEALAWEASHYSPGGAGWSELTKEKE
jgi:hypothetical protein